MKKTWFVGVFITIALVIMTGISAYAVDFSWELGSKTALPGEGPDLTTGNIVDANCNTYYDGENFWVFYTGDNVFNRYVGPDMDHLTKLEPSKLIGFDAIHGDDVYWVNGIYVDENGRWYTTLHVEFNYGDGIAHERKIMYAVSDDNAATWTRMETIITGDGPEYASECQGRYETFGCGDQKLYVDEKSGYIYCYYMKALVDKTNGDSFKTICAARSPISAHMKKGSWQKWYNGQWCEPGIGGHDTPLFSPQCTAANIVYNTYLGKYMAIGWQKPYNTAFISVCSSLASNDWSTPQYFAPAGTLGYYIMMVDMNTNSGSEMGQSFRLYNFSASSAEPYYFTVTLNKDIAADTSKYPYYYPDYSEIKGVSYLSEYNDIISTTPKYAYSENFDNGAGTWYADGNAEISVINQQNVMNVKNSSLEQVIITDANSKSYNNSVLRFTVNMKHGSSFGVYTKRTSENDYLLLSYKDGEFILENAAGRAITLYKAYLKKNFTYGIRFEHWDDRFVLKVDETTVYDNEIPEFDSASYGKSAICSYPETEVNYDDFVQYDGIRLMIDNYEIAFDSEPVFTNNSIMVPMRKVFELFGAYVSYDSSTEQIFVKKDNASVWINMGSSKANVNGVTVDMGGNAEKINGTTMLPLSFMSKLIGFAVAWDEENQLVKITSNGRLAIKLPKIAEWEIPWANGEGETFVNDYLEDFNSTYKTVGEFGVVQDRRLDFDITRRIFRHGVYMDCAEYARIYEIRENIINWDIGVYCVENIPKYYEIYLSDDGVNWVLTDYDVTNICEDPNRAGFFFASLVPKSDIQGNYRFLKIKLMNIGEYWRNQLCRVEINYDDQIFVSKTAQLLDLPQYIYDNIDLPKSALIYPTTIQWSVENNPYLNSSGQLVNRPLLKDGDYTVKITADIYSGSASAKKEFYVIIPASSGTAVKDDSENYSENTMLTDIGANEDFGWTSGYTVEKGSVSAAKIRKTSYGLMAGISPSADAAEGNSEVTVRRDIKSEVNLDRTRTYYITWQQRMPMSYSGVRYKSQRVIFNGVTINGASNKEFSVVSMADLTESNNIDADRLPLFMILKLGDSKRGIGPDNKNTPFFMVKGQMYTFVMRIDSSESSNDIIHLKAFPSGSPEPYEWQITAEADLSGIINSISYNAVPEKNTDIAYFGNLNIESLNNSDTILHENAEYCIKYGDIASAKEMVSLITDGQWKEMLNNQIECKSSLVCENVEIIRNGLRVSDISGVNTGITLPIQNNSSEDRNFEIIVAEYKDGVLTDCRLKNVSVSAGSAILFEDLLSSEGADEAKIFMLNNLDDIKPLRNIIMMKDDIKQ